MKHPFLITPSLFQIHEAFNAFYREPHTYMMEKKSTLHAAAEFLAERVA